MCIYRQTQPYLLVLDLAHGYHCITKDTKLI